MELRKTMVGTIGELIEELQKLPKHTRLALNNYGTPPTLAYDEDRHSVIINGNDFFKENGVNLREYIDIVSMGYKENDAFNFLLSGHKKSEIEKSIKSLDEIKGMDMQNIYVCPSGEIIKLRDTEKIIELKENTQGE